jgi:hypothetical protein
MKQSSRIAFLAGLVFGAIIAVLVMAIHANYDPSVPTVLNEPTPEVSPAAATEPQPDYWDQLEREREHLRRLTGEWASWDGQQVANFDGRILRFQSAKGWPDLDSKSFLLGTDLQILSESGLYFVKAYYSDMDAMHFVKQDLASEDLSSFILFRAGTPRARARPPLPHTPPPPAIQAMLDSMARMNSAADLNGTPKPDSSANDLPIEVIQYDGTSLGGDNPDMIVRLGEGDEWMVQISQSRGKVTRQRIIRGSAELVRKGEGGIAEHLYPYYVDGKLITGASATGLHEVKLLSEGSDER